MKKVFRKSLAILLTMAMVLSCLVTSTAFITSAETVSLTDDVEVTRKTYTFDTMDGINSASSCVEVKDGALVLKGDGTGYTRQVGFDFPLCNGKTYGVSIVYKVPTGSQSLQIISGYGSKTYLAGAIKTSAWTTWNKTEDTHYNTYFTVADNTIEIAGENYYWLKLNAVPISEGGTDVYIDSITIYEAGADATIEFNATSEFLNLGSATTVPHDGYMSFTGKNSFFGLPFILAPSTTYSFEVIYRVSSGTISSANLRFCEGASTYKSTTYSATGWKNNLSNITNAKWTGTFTSSADAGSGDHIFAWLQNNSELSSNELIIESVRIYQAGGTVAFETNTDDVSVDSVTGSYRSVVNLTAPVRYGYNFEGWYYDAELTNKTKSFVNIPAAGETKTLYAKWSEAEDVAIDFSNTSDLKAGEGGTTVTDGQLKMTNTAGSQARALLPYVPKAGRTYSISFKYRSEHELTETATSATISLQLNMGRDTTAWSMFRGDENLETVSVSEGGTKLGNLIAPKSTDNGEWMEQSFVFTVPDEYPTKVKDETTTYIYKYLGFRIQPNTVEGTLYIDDIVIKEATEFDFSSNSNLGNAYSADITDGAIRMYAKSGSQSRVRIPVILDNEQVYKVSLKYKAGVTADYNLRFYASKTSTNYGSWAIFGGDDEGDYLIKSAFNQTISADDEWVSAEYYIFPKCVTEDYKYLGLWMQPAYEDSTVECELYIDDVAVTEIGGAVILNFNDDVTANEDIIGYEVGEVVTLPTPVRNGYNFDGWYLDEDLNKVAGDTFTVVAKNVNLYAKWIEKIAAETPDAPTLESHTQDSVTLVAVEGYEYSINAQDWQSESVFTGLFTGTEYTFYQRVAETDTTLASEASLALVYKITANGDVNADGTLNADDLVIIRQILLNVVTEYDFDGANSNGDETVDIRDLVSLKKKLVSSLNSDSDIFFLIDNEDANSYALNNTLNSKIGNEIQETFTVAVNSRNSVNYAENSDKTIEISVDETLEKDFYKIYVLNGNLYLTATSEYVLLEAVRIFSDRISSYPENMKLDIQEGYLFEGKYSSIKTLDKYNLVWSDEFNGTELDTNVWTVDKWTEENCWIDTWNLSSGSTLKYTDEYISVKDGAVHLGSVTVKNDDGSYSFYGSDIRTNKKMTFSYGYFEARLIMPGGVGQWSAFWANGFRDSVSANPNDYSTEIDVMENFGYIDKYHTDLHIWGNSTVGGILNEEDDGKYHLDMLSDLDVQGENLSTEYHVYGCEWTETAINLYLDGNCYYQINFSDFEDSYVNSKAVAEHFANLINGDEMQLLLTAGPAPGHNANYSYVYPSNSEYMYNTEMVVDYVRLYQIGGKESVNK